MAEKRLTLDMMPQPRKAKEKTKRYGFVKKAVTRKCNFRLNVETDERLSELAKMVMKKLKLQKENRTLAMEMLINGVYETPGLFNKLMKT